MRLAERDYMREQARERVDGAPVAQEINWRWGLHSFLSPSHQTNFTLRRASPLRRRSRPKAEICKMCHVLIIEDEWLVLEFSRSAGTNAKVARLRIMRNNPWLSLAVDSCFISLEASTVIGLRLSKIAVMDPAGVAEAQLMVSEKIEAVAQLQFKALTGGLGSNPHRVARHSLNHYRKVVRKNVRRLSADKNPSR